jgi:hypothetical protein
MHLSRPAGEISLDQAIIVTDALYLFARTAPTDTKAGRIEPALPRHVMHAVAHGHAKSSAMVTGLMKETAREFTRTGE